jgi:hypothetical protein
MVQAGWERASYLEEAQRFASRSGLSCCEQIVDRYAAFGVRFEGSMIALEEALARSSRDD